MLLKLGFSQAKILLQNFNVRNISVNFVNFPLYFNQTGKTLVIYNATLEWKKIWDDVIVFIWSYDDQKALQWRSYDLMRALKIANGKNHSLTWKLETVVCTLCNFAASKLHLGAKISLNCFRSMNGNNEAIYWMPQGSNCMTREQSMNDILE